MICTIARLLALIAATVAFSGSGGRTLTWQGAMFLIAIAVLYATDRNPRRREEDASR